MSECGQCGTERETERSPVFEVVKINQWDGYGLWVTAHDPDGMEVELTLGGFTPVAEATWRQRGD